ncbi:MAG: cytochrome P460 family protein [Ignavibacteriae bacterium]|nr:cytochrome P460 family protein [Ignavibacteriota bacterium]
MKKYNILLIIISFGFIIGLNSCSKDNGSSPSPQEFVADDNTFGDFMSWTLIKTNQGPDPLLGTAHAGNDSTVTRKIYIKNNQERVNGSFPLGTILVKHSSNPAGTVNEFTAMVKRGNNFNPDGNDWEWFMLMPDGTIATKDGMKIRGANLMNGMCVGCHSANKTKDFVFSK